MTKFKKGDKVVFTEKVVAWGVNKGDTGVVIEVDDCILPCRVEVDKSKDCWWVRQEQIEFIKLKKGTRVKVVGCGKDTNAKIGDTGVIEDIGQTLYGIIRDSDMAYRAVEMGDVIELKVEKPRFKVYDKVRVVKSIGVSTVNIGDTAVIEKVNERDYKIRMDKLGEVWYASDAHLEPVEKVEGNGMKFKVGDKVRVRTDLEYGKKYGKDTFVIGMGDARGKVCTIRSIYSGKYGLGEYMYNWTDEMLEPVDEPVVKPVVESTDVVRSEDAIAIYITIGNVTIAVPKGCPVGISKKHPEDEHNEEVGNSIALLRMVKDATSKGMI